ncbi:MAG: hypothetical protein ABSC89_11165 [Verrucomicrobiota bacterium]
MKDVAVPIITTLLGTVGGFVSGVLLERWASRRRVWHDFAIEIWSVIQELKARGENLDEGFLKWHDDSIRRLSVHVGYFAISEPKWWASVEPAWKEYEMASEKKTLESFMAHDITQKKLLARLYALRKSIQDAS